MKFCAVVCEFNPFHNGHRYLLEEAKKRSGCDGILCIMSGNFTQRGESALFDRCTRARHAVLGGADAVVELPVLFATASAEIFAKGAISLLAQIPDVMHLAFGCESGTAEDFLAAAKTTLDESKEFRLALKEEMKRGTSYLRARTELILSAHPELDRSFFTRPNNILGLEYCRALFSCGAAIAPLPVPRRGEAHGEHVLKKEFSSSTAIRLALQDGKQKRLLRKNVPQFVYSDLKDYRPHPYGQAVMCALAHTDAKTLASRPDCTEGLENRLKALSVAHPDYAEFLQLIASKRYTLARLRRILCANFLGIERGEAQSALSAPLYLRTLAVKKEKSEEILSALSRSPLPVVVRRSDAEKLGKAALACMEKDVSAVRLYDALTATRTGEYQTRFV